MRAQETERDDERDNDGGHAPENRAGDFRAGVPSNAVTRTPAESQGFLVRRLPRDTAEVLAAEAFDAACGIVAVDNTVTNDEIGGSPKLVFSMRRGLKAVTAARMLQVNDRTFEEFVAQLRARRDVVYGTAHTTDSHDVVSVLAERCSSLATAAQPVVRRLAKNRTIKVADVKLLEAEIEAAETALRRARVLFERARREGK